MVQMGAEDLVELVVEVNFAKGVSVLLEQASLDLFTILPPMPNLRMLTVH